MAAIQAESDTTSDPPPAECNEEDGMSGTEHLIVERTGHTLVVTMNRPEAKNALSQAMLVGLADAWVELNDDPDLRCGVLTGSGGSFCTGMDLKAAAADHAGPNPYAARWEDDPDLHWKALLRHFRLRKPLIAAVEGHAVAGGTEILQATHLRVAGESATFGVFEARRGLFPVGGSTVRLQRQIGYTHALEMLLTARAYTAAEARDIGLIGHVVPDGQALEKALELADLVAANGPLAVEAILRSVQETASLDEQAALALELEIGWPVFATNDAKEGPRAFAEKRPPTWTRT
jgi:enoyl-CoA hydratase